MFAKASPERRTARAIRALLEGVESGCSLAQTMQMLVVLGGLEHLLPSVLSEIHPYWKGESLDGFFLADTKKLDYDKAELRGVCILISDQSITPFHVQMQLSASADELDWLECRLGKRGDGAGGMERIPWSKWSGHSYAVLQDSLKPIEWAYAVTFGEKRPIPN
jgi:hypothetical protein